MVSCLAEQLEERVNVSSGDLRQDGICMIGWEHELYAVANLSPNSVSTKKFLANKQHGLGLETAKRTLKVTTQVGFRKYVYYPVARLLKTQHQAIRCLILSGNFYTDTTFSPTVLLRRYLR
jgi:hypothetical protein